MRVTLILIASILLTSCTVGSVLVRPTMPLIESGIEELNRETDLKKAEKTITGNLKILEGMIKLDPNNALLRTYAAQAYYALAYGFNEDTGPERASDLYQRGVQHGIKALELNGADNLRDSTLADFNKEVGSMRNSDVAAMFWTAGNWGKWIDLHRDDPEAIAQLSRATALMQRVIDLEETFYYGGAHMYFGVYYGSRAPTIGGDFKKSKRHFDRAREITNGKLLIPDLLRAQYLARQQFERKRFHQLLTGIVDAPDDLMPELALQNQIAKRKAVLLLKKEQEWF
ncbi:MAG: TRAP transporter TatT component family protein [Pseudomonadota bacterium]